MVYGAQGYGRINVTILKYPVLDIKKYTVWRRKSTRERFRVYRFKIFQLGVPGINPRPGLWITVGRKGRAFFQMIECHLHMLIKQFYQSLKKPWGRRDIGKSGRAVRLPVDTRQRTHTSEYLCQYYASISRRPGRDKTRRIRFHSRTPLHFVGVSATRHIKAGIREQDVVCQARGKNSAMMFFVRRVCLHPGGRRDRMSAIIQRYVLGAVGVLPEVDTSASRETRTRCV